MSPDAAAMAAFVNPLKEAVDSRRELGMKRAIHEVARAFGLTERRVRAAVYGEVRQVLGWEVLQVRQRLELHLEQEAARLDAQAAVLRARRAALKDVV